MDPTYESPTQSKAATPHNLIDAYAYERVDYHVAQTARTYGLKRHDQDDLRQDLLTAICAAAARYDPRKAKPRTFVCGVIELEVANFKRSIRNKRRCPARAPMVLSQLQRDGRAFAPRAPRWCEPSAQDLVLDLRQRLSGLNRRQQQLAEALKNQTKQEIAAERGVHRATIYRDIAAMRDVLSTFNLSPTT
jgi:DNA-directed RNA polymerase specialized sigma24 family protein